MWPMRRFMIGSFHLILSLLALLIAVTTVYQAFDVAPRLATSRERWQRGIWYGLGTWLLGLGIWAQHFVGLLARVRQLHDGLDPLLCLASGLLAQLVGFTALRVTDVAVLSRQRLLVGGLLIGAGVVPMHFADGGLAAPAAGAPRPGGGPLAVVPGCPAWSAPGRCVCCTRSVPGRTGDCGDAFPRRWAWRCCWAWRCTSP